MTQTLISERAQISSHSIPPLERYTTATTRSYPITVCRKTRKLGIADHYHLYILIQVLVRFLPGSYRREYRPLQKPLFSLHLSPNTPYPLQTLYGPFTLLQHPSRTFYPSITLCELLQTRYLSLRTLFPPATNSLWPTILFTDVVYSLQTPHAL